MVVAKSKCEILPFCTLPDEGDTLTYEQFSSHKRRTTGFKIGEPADQALMNTILKQSSIMWSGLAQIIADYGTDVVFDFSQEQIEEGIKKILDKMVSSAFSGSELVVAQNRIDALEDKISELVNIVNTNSTTIKDLIAYKNDCISNALCDFFYFRKPDLPTGYLPAQGSLLYNANTIYPEAWSYLQTANGEKLCKTEEEWQAMTKATWATLADGTEVGWNGVGGAPFYVVDTTKNTLRLPDLRGMVAEASGFDGLEVGIAHGDMSRKVEANAKYFRSGYGLICSNGSVTGAFYKGTTVSLSVDWHNSNESYPLQFDSSRVVPTGNANKPRAWGANACVYLGKPQINNF